MRVEVREPGTGGVVATSEPDRECSGDIGLQLVDMVPTRWGVSREAGTNVWFEFHAPGDGSGSAPAERVARRATHRRRTAAAPRRDHGR